MMQPSAVQPPPLHPTVLDASAQRIARTYAAALLDAAARRGQVGDVLDEFRSLFEELFRAEPRFETLLASAAVSRKPKAEIIRKIFAGRVSDTFLNFLLVLNDHERLDLLRGIYHETVRLFEERSGRMHVQVTSAVPLPEDQRERLRSELRESFHKEPVLEERVDPELLGGLLVRVNDWLFDASVRTRLQNIRNQLIERSSHEIQTRRDRFSTDSGD